MFFFKFKIAFYKITAVKSHCITYKKSKNFPCKLCIKNMVSFRSIYNSLDPDPHPEATSLQHNLAIFVWISLSTVS